MRWRPLLPLALAALLVATPTLRAQRISFDSTDAPTRQFVAWTQFYAKQLRLEGWTIIVRNEALPPQWVAKTLTNATERRAEIVFSAEAVARQPRPTLVALHELLHIKTGMLAGFTLALAGDDVTARFYIHSLLEQLVAELTGLTVWPEPPN